MNSRQTTVIIHVATWAALLLVPIMAMRPIEGTNAHHVLTSLGVVVSFMVVFYPNYLWITPNYYTKGKWAYLLLLNLGIITMVAVGLHCWIETCNTLFPDPRHQHAETGAFPWGHLLRNVFNLGIVAFVASSQHLASRWRQNEEARLEAEAARVEAELKTLRNQVNPHFLLNTLNNIYALTAISAERAQEAIQQLSKMLRHLLYDYEQPTVSLKDEVEFLENYASLMKIRLAKSVDVTFSVQCNNYDVQVAPMLFIPLLENAFKHGISPTEPSFIHLQMVADAQSITCDIQNSNHPKNEQDNSGHGIGLQQVQRRLDLAYPNQYTWQHGASADGKTYQSKITIRL